MNFTIFTGDGNGLVGRYTVYSTTMADTIDIASRFKLYNEPYHEEREGDIVTFICHRSSHGFTAHNGAAYHIIEIRPEQDKVSK